MLPCQRLCGRQCRIAAFQTVRAALACLISGEKQNFRGIAANHRRTVLQQFAHEIRAITQNIADRDRIKHPRLTIR